MTSLIYQNIANNFFVQNDIVNVGSINIVTVGTFGVSMDCRNDTGSPKTTAGTILRLN